MTMALIPAVPRRLVDGEKLIRSGGWKGRSPGGMLGRRIGGKKLANGGMGRIGPAVDARARLRRLGPQPGERRGGSESGPACGDRCEQDNTNIKTTNTTVYHRI